MLFDKDDAPDGIPDLRQDRSPDDAPDAPLDDPSPVAERFQKAIRGVDKPKPLGSARLLKSITNEEKRQRMILVDQLARLGMAAEQMVDFLPTWGVPISRSTVYEYLAHLKLPRSYRSGEKDQSHHDYFTLRAFIRIARDAAEAGHRTKRLLKGRLAWEGVRFRPDFKFEVGRYLFFMEMQLSDLTETRWSVKFANYYRLRERLGLPFRALFVIDQKGDLNYCRRFAREFLKRKGEKNLFLFLPLDALKAPGNTATDPLWIDAWGSPVSLLRWLSPTRAQPGLATPANRTSIRSPASETWSVEDHPSPTEERAALDEDPPVDVAPQTPPQV